MDSQAQAGKGGASHRTENFTELEAICICDAWMEIEQDPICGAQQRGGMFWRKIYNYFHEHKHLGETPFVSDQTEISLTQRWEHIQEQVTKFNNSYDKAALASPNSAPLVW